MKAEINWTTRDIMTKTSKSYGDEEHLVYYQSSHFFDEQIKTTNVDGIFELKNSLTTSLDLIKNEMKSTT